MTVTYKGILNETIVRLREAGLEDCEFDAECLLEFCTGKGRTYLVLHSTDAADETISVKLHELCSRRIKGEPLQYILGEWEFMGFKFSVGKGVLIPRQETELLVETSVDRIKKMDSPVIFDLCSGTGCIGLSVAKLCSNSKVYLLEKSDEAFDYLLKNREYHKLNNAFLVKADITKGFDSFDLPQPDIILSNPPYIKQDEIPVLQKELMHEPLMALCGGADGLDFYRSLVDLWLPSIKKGGYAAFECGETQAKNICVLASDIVQYYEIKKDLSGIDRVVCLYF